MCIVVPAKRGQSQDTARQPGRSYLRNADTCRLLVSTSCAQNDTICRRSTHREVVGATGDMALRGGSHTFSPTVNFVTCTWVLTNGEFLYSPLLKTYVTAAVTDSKWCFLRPKTNKHPGAIY